MSAPGTGDRKDELAEIDRMLRALPPIEPPAALVARTRGALAAKRAGRAKLWLGLGVATAGVLATVGVTMFARPQAGPTSARHDELRDDAQELAYNTATGEEAGGKLAGQGGRGEVDLPWKAANQPPATTATTTDKTAATTETTTETGTFGKVAENGRFATATPEVFANKQDSGVAGGAGADLGGVVGGQTGQGESTIVMSRLDWVGDAVVVDGKKSEDVTLGLKDGDYRVTLQQALDEKSKAGFDDARNVVATGKEEPAFELATRDASGLAFLPNVDHANGEYWKAPIAAPVDATDHDADGVLDVDDGPKSGSNRGLDGNAKRDKSGANDGYVAGRDEDGEKSRDDDTTRGPRVIAGKVTKVDEVYVIDQVEEVKNGIDTPDEGERVSGLVAETPPSFIAARGYFANTYVPGDPEVAWLRQTVANGWQKQGQRVPLDELAAAPDQPFDAPRDQAIALHVAADRAALNGPTRMTLQVGITGAPQAPARRAPLAIALVVDLGSLVGQGGAGAVDADRRVLWSLAEAFVAERQAGDRMSLVVAAPSGPEVLQGDALGVSEVTRFLASALERQAKGTGAGVSAALQRAYGEVQVGAKSETTMGGRVVVLATAKAPSDAAAIAQMAHDQAIAGTQLAVIGAGTIDDASGATLAGLASAGQGRRWLVTRPEDARRALGQELAASGRAVARALRLQLRLAPGVQLVAVLGSHPLAVPEAERVREAERAIDRKVAETTGIQVDRGADEDGIQIVIPAFLAGDDHVILLDVVVPGPGPVLEVHARFKDLIRMENGQAQASLSLEDGKASATPLTRNVVSNRAAYDTALALREAATRVAAGDVAAARVRLDEALASLAKRATRGLSFDGDRNMLSAYAAVLRDASWVGDVSLTQYVTRSMRLAAAIRTGAR